ncbi:MAG: DUF1906 domain-containing protein [Symploca sp. SIO1B1]|nr:DUF1906 domain-containing protein [Symploca sp. SIO1C2]NER47827.1 DUF1906 domain-containing protein [Symploca sp. SIO1A3]NES00913.1 DUF1906 domain-containing protein [Symploca sp. SIO1B1]
MSYPNLNGVVQSAPNKSLGFDVDSRISRAVAEEFHSQGYKFCLRYISLGASEAPEDLSHEEAIGILEAGLALMPVQHVRNPGWPPSAELGKRYGEEAANHADQIGFPSGVNLWCDLEGISSSATAQDVIAYCNAWHDAVAIKEHTPGLYVGANTLLNGEQLYQDLKFKHYWKSASKVHTPAPRGYQMIQSEIDIFVNHINIDKNITYIDNEGGRPQWLINPRFV